MMIKKRGAFTKQRWMFEGSTRPAAAGGVNAYVAKILALSPFAYYKLIETSGNAADSSGNSLTGTASGITWNSLANAAGDGNAPKGDGLNDYIDMANAGGFDTPFDGDTGSIVFDVWSSSYDKATEYVIHLKVDASYSIQVFIRTSPGGFGLFRVAAGGSKGVLVGSGTMTTSAWQRMGITWDSGTVKVYRQGAQTGGDQAGGAGWIGSLDNSAVSMMASDNSGTSSLDGYLSHVAFFNTVLSGATFTDLGAA